MKANEMKVVDFLSYNKTQFTIPVYQRNYDWSKNQCQQFFSDIYEAGVKKSHAHFIGSIVYVHDDVYTSADIKELTIIDGQQRLTTLTLLYLALYRFSSNTNNLKQADEIKETYLTNKFAPESKKFKLNLTDNNKEAIEYLFRNDEKEEFTEFSKIINNFYYFDSLISANNYKIILEGLSKLMFVEISLDRQNDEPQKIFESLNSTGLELSQSDLIRNYILMWLSSNNQKNIYENYRNIIEKLARDQNKNISKVSDFIRDFLTLMNKKIPKKSEVYFTFKKNYPISSLSALENNLSWLKSLAKFYNKLINPENENDKEIRLQLYYIDRLEVNVAFPFLMKVYEDYNDNIIDKSTFIEILELIQSFAWRRFIVGLPTNALNKIFMILYEKIEKENYLVSLQKWLVSRSGSQGFPNNKEVKDVLEKKDVYNIKSKNRTYFLERLENFNNKEQVLISGNENITVEHIFPKNPNFTWKQNLEDEDYRLLKETYLNTVGNLTLSGNNGKLSNKSFLEKRDMEVAGYRDSRLRLNKHLSEIEEWNVIELKKRYQIIIERFFNIWKFPEINFIEEKNNEATDIFDAEPPTYKKLEYAIFMDQKIEVDQVSTLYVDIFTNLFDLQPEAFFSTDLSNIISLTKNPKRDKLVNAKPINDIYFIETNLSSIDKFKKIKQALEILELQDELMIKYSD